MPKSMGCLRCQTPMRYLKTEKLQFGQTGWITGDLPNLLAGAMEADIYCCPNCGKIELYRPETASEFQIAQTECPHCGMLHDIDDPKCPFCKR